MLQWQTWTVSQFFSNSEMEEPTFSAFSHLKTDLNVCLIQELLTLYLKKKFFNKYWQQVGLLQPAHHHRYLSEKIEGPV